jgi:hypothetical protein
VSLAGAARQVEDEEMARVTMRAAEVLEESFIVR